MNEAKEKAMKWAEELLCKTFNLDTFDYHSIRIMREVYETAIDIALQERAKEIIHKIESHLVDNLGKDTDDYAYLLHKKDWKEIKESVGVKEK